MTLENIKLVDRKRLTSHYPVLLASETGTGKSFAFAQLTPEEKKRTYILNFDGKSISVDDLERVLTKTAKVVNEQLVMGA